jgi:hypothetical protein
MSVGNIQVGSDREQNERHCLGPEHSDAPAMRKQDVFDRQTNEAPRAARFGAKEL